VNHLKAANISKIYETMRRENKHFYVGMKFLLLKHFISISTLAVKAKYKLLQYL